MKAISLKNPGQFELIELPDVETSSLLPDEALVRIGHVGLCGTDIHAYHGNQPFFSYPRILGHELGVVVEAVGSQVSNVRIGMHCAVEAYLSEPGDRAFSRGLTNCSASTKCLGVHVDGGMREHFVLPANKLHPSDLPTRSLALVETLCIGHHAVARAQLHGDEVTAVVGMGPIGLGVLQFARLAGTQAVAIDISEERLQMARDFYPGLKTILVNPASDITEAWSESGLEPPEVVWDCTGNKASTEKSMGLSAHGGKMVLVGIYNGELSFFHPDLHKRELSLLCSRNATAKDFRAVIHLIENGLVNADIWITHECEMTEFPGIIDSWLAPGSGLLKGVIGF